MTLEKIAMFLVIIGALNWGLIGALNLNLVEKLTGNNASVNKLVYILVGLAALYVAVKKLSGKKKTQ
jgi:uncharacterized membrane protein YuzA (DUF378 family)